MLNRRIFFQAAAATLAAPLLASPGFAQPSGGSGRSRRPEIAALRSFAETTHPRGREAAAAPSWRERWAALERDADQLSDGAYFIRARRALGWFRDGHTTLLPFEFVGGVPETLRNGAFGLTLPLRLSIFTNGVYLTRATGDAIPQLGGRVLRIGRLPIEAIMQALMQDWPGNAAWMHRHAPASLNSPALLQGLSAINDATAPVEYLVAQGGTEVAISVAPLPGRPAPTLQPFARTDSGREVWAREAGAGNYVRRLDERRAIYVSIDEMGDATGRTFAQLTDETFEALRSTPADRVIIDLRRNGGGNNYLGEPLRKRLAASRFNRPGGLFVLISPATFSAAQNLANRMERETLATFVGEPTGGAPNHYGDAQMFRGDATGIAAIVSTIPWFDSYPQDSRRWLMPDLLVPSLFADWAAGRDAQLEAALAHQASEGDERDRDRVFYFSRPSQARAWQPFWNANPGITAAAPVG